MKNVQKICFVFKMLILRNDLSNGKQGRCRISCRMNHVLVAIKIEMFAPGNALY